MSYADESMSLVIFRKNNQSINSIEKMSQINK